MKTVAIFITLLYSVTLSAQERVTLVFVGDLMQHQAQINAARQAPNQYDYSSCFSLVKDQITRADIAVANLEVTLAGTPYTGYPAFSAPDAYLQAIKEAGFNVLLTANNHCLDRGKRGLERTIHLLDSLSIPHAGTYRNPAERKQRYPLIIRKNGFCIALLNYTYGTNGITVRPPNLVNYIDKETILQDIHTAQAAHPDAIIACMHWGEEYQQLPNSSQRELADWLLKQGVTHIIGSHPHVIQPMEMHTNGNRQNIIVYSLGNFISNMSAPHTDGGLIFTLQLEKHPFTQTTRVQQCHYTLVWTARPVLTQEKNYQLYPSYSSTQELPLQARNRLNIFMKNARNLLQKHNIGIEEHNK